jgi:hypothetical protein
MNSSLLLLLCWLLFCVSIHGDITTNANYLQSESVAVSSALQNVQSFLRSKGIATYGPPIPTHDVHNKKTKVVVSTKKHPLECRISLDTVEPGKKCVAPCSCIGSQEFIQFSEFNKLRRKDPGSWVTCQTCMQPFDYSFLNENTSGLKGFAISTVLDKPVYMRAGLFMTICFAWYITSFHKLLLKFLVSKWFWNHYGHIQKIVHLPLVLKFWLGKIVYEYLAAFYLKVEARLVEKIAEMETDLLEDNI